MNRLNIVKGDIVKAKTEAIVNAANTALLLEIYVSSETEPISNLTGILSIKKIA